MVSLFVALLLLFATPAAPAAGAPPDAQAVGVTVLGAGPQPFVQVFTWGGGRLGISVRDVDQADVDREKLPGRWGVVVEEVRSGSPAEKGGLKVGDVLVEYDGERVRGVRQFVRLVQETPEGRTVKAAVVRGGKRVELELRPEAAAWPWAGERLGRELDRLSRELRLRIRPELRGFGWWWAEPPAPRPLDRAGRLGVVVQDLSPQLAEYFGAKDGVLVASVTPGSAAERAGVKAGDVITAVAGTKVARVSDLQRRVAQLEAGREYTLEVVRDRKPLTLKVTPEGERTPAARRRVITL